MDELSHRYLTTKELANLLRIKERKVYELAASGDVPCSRAMGKLLFPRDKVEAWLATNSTGTQSISVPARPAVILGSHEPLLDWALRESRCGLAAYFDSSLDGLERYAQAGGIATGLHVPNAAGEGWNSEAVRGAVTGQQAVLVEWAKRDRGFIVPANNPDGVSDLASTVSRRFVARQREAGSQLLLSKLLADAGIDPAQIHWTTPVRSEADAAMMVQEGSADIAFGLSSIANQFRLGFVPVIQERYDLLIDRRAWFEPPLQTLVDFCRSDAFHKRAKALAGYDVSGQFTVQYNAP